MILTTEQVQEMYTHYQQHGLEATAKAFGRRKHGMQEIFERRGLLPREITPKRERQYRFADKLTDEQRDYIKGHYKKVKRSVIAKRVGIRDKRVFNFICLELGLSS